MRDCGFDEVKIDAVGNVVGVYHAQSGVGAGSRRLLTGSHYDTVRNGGKYDGRLGIFVPMICVRELHRAGRRLPFALEVVGFAEEEGQRYKATFLGSGALRRPVRRALARAARRRRHVDARRHAPRRPAGDARGHRRAAPRPGETTSASSRCTSSRGPCSTDLGLPLGVVTSINGGVRYAGEVRGMASHAGTTPMTSRRDAAAAVAELALYLEKRAGAEPNLVGTMGMLDVPNGSTNVVPGRCRFTLDIRSTTDAVRDALHGRRAGRAARDLRAARRLVSIEETMRAAAAPSAPEWQARWERAVAAAGLPVHCMPSGAGHDAMKLAEILPQAMLFVRGENAGISHNPLESSTADDMQLAIDAFLHLLDEPGRRRHSAFVDDFLRTARRLDRRALRRGDARSCRRWCACRPTRRPATTRRTPSARPSCSRTSASSPIAIRCPMHSCASTAWPRSSTWSCGAATAPARPSP